MIRRLLFCVLLACSAYTAVAVAQPDSSRERTRELENAANEALFSRSNLAEAERLAGEALTADSTSIPAHFVLMEAAALQGNEDKLLDAALAICEADPGGSSAYARIAAQRIKSIASASEAFQARIPRLQRLAASSDLPPLHLALVNAASDGASEMNELIASRESGLLTDWRIVGPFGTHPHLDFDRTWDPERDGIKKSAYGSHKVEFFQFADGQVKLPSYLAKDGVFYALSQIYLRSDGQWRVFLESGGTLEVFIDGIKVLSRDDRQGAPPQNLRTDLTLPEGDHKILVKFLPGAAPFRLAIMAPTGGLRPHPNIPNVHAEESDYVSAALHYWEGDLASATEELETLIRTRPSASAYFLLAKTWTAVDESSPEPLSEYEAALKLAPSSTAVELAAATAEFRAHRVDAALARLQRVLPAKRQQAGLSSGSAAAAVPAGTFGLFAEVAASLGWDSDQGGALRALVERSPSCDNLRRAADFFLFQRELSSVNNIAERLGECDPLALAKLLAYAGDHRAASRQAAKAIARNPTDRAAREFQVRELMLAGMHAEASAAARELQALAPNSDQYRELARQAAMGATVLSRSRNTTEFYAAYRREGTDPASSAARFDESERAVILLNDAVLDVAPDGTRRVYVHVVTRVLNREGIEQFGEISLPAGARILELRTIKSNGSILEPELSRQKQTVTMPALAAGDVIEQEFVLDHAEAAWNDFLFGSFQDRVLRSRFALIAPASFQITRTNLSANAKIAKQPDGRIARVWEANDLKTLIRENNVPDAQLFPTVHVIEPEAALDRYAASCREAVLEAGRPGVRSIVLAHRLTLPSAKPEQKARELEAWVKAHVQSDGQFDCSDLSSAEETLQSRLGSRSVAFLALAKASGLETEMLLARSLGADDEPERFSHPLVRIKGEGSPAILDLESENAGFGALPIKLDYLKVMCLDQSHENNVRGKAWIKAARNNSGYMNFETGRRSASGVSEAQFIAFSSHDQSLERSDARGDLTLSSGGDLRAEIVIHLGTTRSAQVRGTLLGADKRRRQRFLEQVAGRLLPGATDVSGSIDNLEQRDNAVNLSLQFRVPRFTQPAAGTIELQQMTPGLGLGRMYAPNATRSYPLLIDDALFESSRFTVHLPPEVSLVHAPSKMLVHGEFGSYHFEMLNAAPHELRMIREFNIPVQLVSAGEYPRFRDFAAQLDAAESEHITVLWNPPGLNAGAATGIPPAAEAMPEVRAKLPL